MSTPADIVSQTADKLGIDPLTKSVATMAAVLGSPDSAVSIMGIGLNAKLTDEAETQNPKPEIKGKYSRTEKKLIEMLQENTGANFLDSGGAYGRAWQRNRGVVNWSDMPEKSVKVEIWSGKWELSITTNVFPYLVNRLELNKETTVLNRDFKQFANRAENKGESLYSLMEPFAEYLGCETKGSFNTYNEDSTLSQVLQGYVLDLGTRGLFVMLQIHGGCDVRGGYTDPYIFADTQGDEFPSIMYEDHDIRADCKCTGSHSNDCGYHWYTENSPADKCEKLTEFGIDPSLAPKEERYKLPSYWAPKELINGSPLVCSKCSSEVSFN
jgi:hypothetical protein